MSDPDGEAEANDQGIPSRRDSPRKEELLHRSLDYIARNSLTDLSLRPLAKDIGTSPRVLLYLFGSKDELIRDVLALSREEQSRVLREALEGSDDAGLALRTLWEWIIDPARDNLRRLFFEAYIHSLAGEGAWKDFAARSVDDWLAHFRSALARDPRCSDPDAEATTVLAVVRGLLLDLLADGDRRRVDLAWRRFIDERYPPRPGRQPR